MMLPVAAAAWCIYAMAHGNGGSLVLPDDSAYQSLLDARGMASGLVRWLDSGSLSLPRPENPLYSLLVLPGALIARPGEFNAPAGWLVMIGLLLSWWLVHSARLIGKSLVGGWSGGYMPVILGVSAPVVLAIYSCGGAGLETALVAALWVSWMGASQDKSRSWWILPAVYSLAISLGNGDGWLYPLACSIAASLQFRRQPGFLRRRVWQSIAAGSGPILAAWVSRYAAGGTLIPTAPGLVIRSIHELSSMSVQLSSTFCIGTWPTSPVPVMIPGAGLVFLVGLFQPGSVRLGMAMGGALVLAGLFSGGGLAVPAFVPFLAVSLSGAMRLSAMAPESWKKTVLKAVVWGWLAWAVPGLMAGISQYGRESASALAGTAGIASAIPADYAGIIIAENPGMAGWFSGRPVDKWPASGRPGLPYGTGISWPELGEIQKLLPSAEQIRMIFAGEIPGPGEKPPVVEQVAGHPAGPGMPGSWLVRVEWGVPAPLAGLPGWIIADEVDCVQPASEKSHEYRGYSRGGMDRPEPVVSGMPGKPGKVDSGWMLDGGEEFIVRADAGKPAVLMARVTADCAVQLGIEWNGLPAGRVPVAVRPGAWQEILVMQKTGDGVASLNHVKVTAVGPPGCRYGSFHWWILQPAEK